MKVVTEGSAVPEPQWILDRTGSGPLYWRREEATTSRVKFRYDVEVKEFHRGAHELDEAELVVRCNMDESSALSMSVTCLVCLMVTVVLPWYIMIGS